MTLKHKKAILKERYFFNVFLGSAIFLAGCSPDKPHLAGSRESFVDVVTPVNFVKKEIVFDKSYTHQEWSQHGGNALHDMQSSILNKQINKQWQKNIGKGTSAGQRFMPNVVASKDLIFTMDTVGKVSAHDYKGNEKWSFETSPEGQGCCTLGGGIAFEDNVLVATTSFAEVFAFNIKTGKLLWKEKMPAPSRTAPTVVSGKVLVPTINNELHALDLKNGKNIWNHQGIQEYSALLGGSSPAVKDDTVIVCYSSGEYYSLSLSTGVATWTDTLTSALRSDTVSSISHIKSNPVIDKDNVYVISHGGRVVANDLKSGSRLWQKDYGSSHDIALGGDFLFIIDLANDLIAIEKNTGDLKWKISLTTLLAKGKDSEPLYFSAPIIANGQLVFTTSVGDIIFLDVRTGKLTSKLETGKSITQQPIVVNKQLLVLNDEGSLSLYR